MTNLQIVIVAVIGIVVLIALWNKYYSHPITCLLEDIIIKGIGYGLIAVPTLYYVYRIIF